ncbi:dihydroxyacetone kinase subunit DhaL [Streptosporangium sp. NPDC020072]|uniref:dihydroxyacetone kinase subunit DhaL n=1 Tax=unclassified Streptosporangium TaxID=2632669 RepID=UPI003445F993
MDTALLTRWITGIAETVRANRERLTELDAAIGDADHGVNLDRGFGAAVQALAEEPPVSPGALLRLVGGTLIRRVGGASGPLYGTAFREAGRHLGSLGDSPEVSPAELARALRAGLDGVTRLGSAAEGDKTMVDALAPAVRALESATASPAAARAVAGEREAFEAAASAALAGAEATIPMVARKGRASYLGPRSAGHEDPGAASCALVFAALLSAVNDPGQG